MMHLTFGPRGLQCLKSSSSKQFLVNSQVNLDNDQVDQAGVGVLLGPEHGEHRGVLPRLGDQAVDPQQLVVKLVLLPREPLVSGALQEVGRALGLEVLDSHDDAALVAHVVLVVTMEHLVPAQALVSREEHAYAFL